MASREYRLRDINNGVSTVLEPVEAGRRVYLANDARRFGERNPGVPHNGLGLLLELVDRIFSSEAGAVEDLPDGKGGVLAAIMAARDVTDVSEWL